MNVSPCIPSCLQSKPVFEEESTRRIVYRVGLIRYTVDAHLLSYSVEEPPLDGDATRVVEAVVEKARVGGVESVECDWLKNTIEEYAERLGYSGHDVDSLVYHAVKLLSPWSHLLPLALDPFVEEASVTAGEPVRVIHRLALTVEYLDSNIVSPGEHRFRLFMQQLAASGGSAVSAAFPLAEADLCGVRATFVYGTVASKSTVSLRFQPENPPSLEDLIENGMISVEASQYLLEVLRSRGMVFIVGPQGTGKTTLLNALLEKLPRDWKLVVVEDVPELRPRHPHFISLRVRRVRSLAESRSVEVGYRDLLRVALRLRGQFTGITEARGEEVLELFEAAAIGEASAATFHARDWRELRLRLYKLGVSEAMLSLLWAVVILGKVRLSSGVVARRVLAIYEVGFDGRERLLWRYDPGSDTLVRVGEPRRVSLEGAGEV